MSMVQSICETIKELPKLTNTEKCELFISLINDLEWDCLDIDETEVSLLEQAANYLGVHLEYSTTDIDEGWIECFGESDEDYQSWH